MPKADNFQDQFQFTLHDELNKIINYIKPILFDEINELFENWYKEDNLDGTHTFDICVENAQKVMTKISLLEKKSFKFFKQETPSSYDTTIKTVVENCNDASIEYLCELERIYGLNRA